MSIFLWR